MSFLPLRFIEPSNYSREYVIEHPELDIEYRDAALPSLNRSTAHRILLKCPFCEFKGLSDIYTSKHNGWRCPDCEEETYLKPYSSVVLTCHYCDFSEISDSDILRYFPNSQCPNCNHKNHLLDIDFI